MLITISELARSNDFQEYSFEQSTHYVRGFVYIYGKEAGADTVAAVNAVFTKKGIIPFADLHGAFDYVIRENSGNVYAFSDNSNQQCLYISENAVSSSFLEMLTYRNSKGTKTRFSNTALCEYYTLGSIYFEKTLADEIYMLPSDEYVLITSEQVCVLPKGVGEIDQQSTLTSIQEFFNHLSFSIKTYNVCQGLTGGYDSRMVFACMKARVNTRLGFSGNDLKSKDIICAQKAAESCGRTLEVVRIPKDKLSYDMVDETLRWGDGIQPLSLDADQRLFKFKTRFREENCDILLTGDGGVLHKDWEWMQDLPFYHKKKTNLRRFYHQRIAFATQANRLGQVLKNEYAGQEIRFVAQLRQFEKRTNTQSYDSLYYNVSGNRRVYYNTNPVHGLVSYAPLNELDLVRYSYHLPRRYRFFYNSIRRTISAADIRVARSKTCYGTTASDEPLYLLRDVLFQGMDYFRKAVRMVSRILFQVSAFTSAIGLLGWSYEEDLRNLAVTGAAVEYAVENGLLTPGTEASMLRYSELQRIVHIYWLAKEYSVVLGQENFECEL